MLEIQDLHVSVHGTPVLKGIDCIITGYFILS